MVLSKAILSTWYSAHLCQLPYARLIAALLDMQLLNMAYFLLGESMSHSFMGEKKNTRRKSPFNLSLAEGRIENINPHF